MTFHIPRASFCSWGLDCQGHRMHSTPLASFPNSEPTGGGVPRFLFEMCLAKPWAKTRQPGPRHCTRPPRENNSLLLGFFLKSTSLLHRWRSRANDSQPCLGPIKCAILYRNAQGGHPVIILCPYVIKERLPPPLELKKYASPSGKSSKKLQTH